MVGLYSCDYIGRPRMERWAPSMGLVNGVSRKDVQMLLMCLTGSRVFSTCSKRQYFSILTDIHNYIVGTGYNGPPSGSVHCFDGGCPRAISDSPHGSNYDNCFALHAEQNAFLHCKDSSSAVTLYVNGPPCFTCAKLIVGSYVSRVVCLNDDNYAQWPTIKEFMESKGIDVHVLSIGELDARCQTELHCDVSEYFSGFRSSE